MIKAPKGYEFKQVDKKNREKVRIMKKLNIIIMFILSLYFTAQGQKQYNFDWEFYYSDGYFTDTGFVLILILLEDGQ